MLDISTIISAFEAKTLSPIIVAEYTSRPTVSETYATPLQIIVPAVRSTSSDQSSIPLPIPLAMSTAVQSTTTSTATNTTTTNNEPTPSPLPKQASLKSEHTAIRPHPKPGYPTCKLRVECHDLNHDGAEVFFSNTHISRDLAAAVSTVQSVLYKPSQSNSHIPPVRSVTLILRAMDGVAGTSGSELDDEHKEISFSLRYISKIPAEPASRRRDEIQGVLVHEMVHCWQWAACGTAPGGLIEGIADFVRLKAGLSPPHWKKQKHDSWDRGYESTGYFLDWIESQYGDSSVRRINEALMNKRYEEGPFWTSLFGKGVPELWNMTSRHDLEDLFNSMRDCFHDRETEQNWIQRDKAVCRLRKITLGNSPKEFKDTYLAGIKSLLEGIIKTCNSLRTTLSASGLDLVQEIAKTKLPGIDGILEIVLPHIVKLCASTKKIGAGKAETTVNVIIENVSYNIYLMKQIWSACDDKNVSPRKSATLWLKTLIGKHRSNKSVFEKGEGLSLFEKCLKKGLADSNPEVRKSMRSAYWAFIRLWPERSEGILSTLSDQHRKVLISETADIALIPTKAAAAPAAKSAAPKPKPSIKDAIAAKRQAAKVEKAAPEPKISMSSSSNSRPAALSTATRTLSSAPVRPSRVVRKPTTTSKAPSPDFTKSAIEVPRTKTPDQPTTPVEGKRPRSTGSISEVIAEMTKGAFSPKSTTGVTTPDRVVTPEEAKRPLTPGTIAAMAKAGWSPKRENESPTPASVATPVTVIRSISKESEAPTLYSVDRPEKPILSRKEGLARKALQELPINHPVNRSKRKMPTTDHVWTPQERWVAVERIHRRQSPPARHDSADNLRKKMRALIDRLDICADENTFHGIVSIIKGNWLVLDDAPELFDRLLNWCIELMESPEDWFKVRADKLGADTNTQTLLTLRAMLANHCSLLSAYFPRILCALLAAAREQAFWTHMRPMLEEMVEDLVMECNISDLEDSIDAVLDFMETTDIDPDPQVISLGLFTLTFLMKRSSCSRPMRPEDQELRIAQLGGRFCKVKFPEIRREAVTMLMRYRLFIENDDRFWRNVESAGPKAVRLLTYYYEKEFAQQQLETERLLLQRALDLDVD
ncbi:MAG: hypothetical protein Q9170_006790 [Blastenia crenularia]